MATSAASPIDHLTTLPSELLQNIASYLFATHEPNIAYSNNDSKRGGRKVAKLQDLDRLAATCHTLRNEVMDWAHHFLIEHRSITSYNNTLTFLKSKAAKKARPTLGPNYLRRNKTVGLLPWSAQRCNFCGKRSARSAIMMSGLKCCSDCDKKEWSDKITKTDAMKEFDLKDYQLLPHLDPEKTNRFRNLGIPRLRYGTYICQGGVTTMFMREDVRRFAEQVHGGLREHMAQRAAQREKLKKTREKNKEKRAADKAAKEVRDAAEARWKAGHAAAERQAMNELVEISDDEGFGDGNNMEHFILIE